MCKPNLFRSCILAFALAIPMALVLSACEPHRIDIQQGNRIKPENLAKLKLGMNRKQVIYVLGTPLLQDPFHQQRWDYIFYLKPGNDPARQSRVTLYFKGDKLIRIDDSAYAPDKQKRPAEKD